MPFLFDEVIFGPVRSRRLGLSLGINLLPTHYKYCSFNCIYCECGWTTQRAINLEDLPSREEVSRYLKERLKELKADSYLPDAITYAGNGEPTLHPDFPGIVADTVQLRDILAPGAMVTVLSNATMLHLPGVFEALKLLDNNIQKLDAGSGRTMRLLNNPPPDFSYREMTGHLKRFDGKVIIQSMFLRGSYRGEVIDNTSDEEVSEWIEQLKDIRPSKVMIYSIARATPAQNLMPVSSAELTLIAGKVNAAGLPVQVYD